MKLWDKGYPLDPAIEAYTAGDDVDLDRALVSYDCTASATHARVLEKAGVLTAEETARIVETLAELKSEADRGEFTIRPEEEDGHTALENRLVAKLGDVGKKIHTARSRNDQVVTALRLYMKERMSDVGSGIDRLVAGLRELVDEQGSVELPGYTHTRRAMPSSIGLWLGSFIESLDDTKSTIKAARNLIDQSPLGTGAGYGIPVLEIDREFAARDLGFARVQVNPLYVQNSRPKFEAIAVSALVDVMADLNKLATDLILFTAEEFGFLSLSRQVCTGSSIMPQKLNPDVLEILRARYHEVLAHEFQIRSIAGNLISGYHRDFQCTKQPLMRSFETTLNSLDVLCVVVRALTVDREACEKACSGDVHATGRVYQLVREGVPFRDAYRKVAAELFKDPPSS
ncbi:MAG: argininosuccinate lyase [Acidobacteria bacterium]|nr:argininosuccinate lyase [Acidobacteriota bacterium]NIM62953.1 argininosuccinate lyase [Acidobacteriota bacterium]NIO59107.1 argininosuccinate lyase [Acidobacteriota bacterium]NIQ30138.1 argininosuccinate lyase [Acidobacteriota bacterium]NIQ84976.1 argininosuccinate lyase [Acidobacteriota bacterium]